jgi:8-oxo-dGTP diphosphatase
MIEAAGGVVWRTTRRWQVEVLVIHRPRRDDWSLPKGKCKRGESALECALREVREETGLRCSVGDELPDTRYTDRKGRAKRVRYWSMEELDGEFRRNAEVDKVRWTPLDRLGGVLTYKHDLMVVSSLKPAHLAVA